MTPSEKIDDLIAQHLDWRGATLALLRKNILETDAGIIEEWKYMGSPVWSKYGMICVGNIFKNQVKLVFADGASLDDPDKLFNDELKGNKRRAIKIQEGDKIDGAALRALVKTAIISNQNKAKK